MDDFTSVEIDVGQTSVFVRTAGSGRPVLLLHGFPQTHLMWRAVAPVLARDFTVVCADLRGYGASGCPPSASDHSPYSKREMAKDLFAAMQRLGHSRFAVVGHDRGGRVAYRMALDSPEHIDRLAVLDIVPTEVAWQCANDQFAVAYWPWSFLAQNAPLPERMLTAEADAVVNDAFDQWGSPGTVFSADVRAAYVAALRDPEHAHAICEEYRAAATIDREHDRADQDARRPIVCPLLVLWSARGPLSSWYDKSSGPLGIWRQWATDARGHSIDAGHFFPEEAHAETTSALREFLA